MGYIRASKRRIESVIALRNIHKFYRMGHQSLHVLKGIDLEIGARELVAIMGASGSGKSTLLNILGILDHYDDGEYILDGTPVRNLSESAAAAFRNRHIGFVFQAFNLLPFKNALENVALPLYYQQAPRRERNRRAREYLERVGLADRAHHMPNELSGGQKQRVAIARALIAKPRVILADEPTGALDSVTGAEIMDLFREINAEGRTVIIVTHEAAVAKRTQRVITLRDGVIVNADSPVTTGVMAGA
jgi:putative ABC transport system ATP-binding protein